MPIGAFSKDFIEVNPGPAIESSTAKLFAEEGARIRKQIEEQSAKAEAQAKAPILTALYTDAYTKISSGDFSGFADLSRATAESATNPFLAAMAHDATSVASRMASDFMATEREKMQQAGAEARAKLNLEAQLKATQEVGERQRQNMLIRAVEKRKSEQANWDSSSPEQRKQFGPRPPDIDESLYTNEIVEPVLPVKDANGGGVNFSDSGVPNPVSSSIQSEVQNLPKEELANRTEGDFRTYSTDEDLQKVKQAELEDKKNFTTYSLGNSNLKLKIVNVEPDAESSISTTINGRTITFKNKDQSASRIKEINEDKETIKQSHSINQDFVSWVGRMGELGYILNDFVPTADGKRYTISATNKELGQTQYWTDSQDVPSADGKGIDHIQAWDQRGKVKTISEKERETWEKGASASKRLVEGGVAVAVGYNSDTLNAQEKAAFEEKSKTDFENAKENAKKAGLSVKEYKNRLNKIRQNLGYSAFEDKEEIKVNEPDLKEIAKNKLLKDAGIETSGEVSLTKIISTLKDKFNGWNIERKKKAIVNLTQMIEDEKSRLNTLTGKNQGGEAESLAKDIVKLESLKKEYEQELKK